MGEESESNAFQCAFYNSRFVLQYVRTNKIDYPVGSLQINFQIEDGAQTHSVYVLEVRFLIEWNRKNILKTKKGEPTKSTLTLDELLIVAENVAKLHGKPADSLGKEVRALKYIRNRFSCMVQFTPTTRTFICMRNKFQATLSASYGRASKENMLSTL